MDSKYCFACIKKLPLSLFPSNLGGMVLATYDICQARTAKSKRKALQQLDPNIPPKRRAIASTRPKPAIPPPNPRPEPLVAPPNPPKSRPETPIRVPTPPPAQP